MRARTAYISSLSTTGVLVASALVMLTIVGALLAFDSWPNHAIAEAESVPIADDGPEAIRRAADPGPAAGMPSAATRAAALARSTDVMHALAARAGRFESRSGSEPSGSSPGERGQVVSALPAPDAAPGAPAGQQSSAGAPAPSAGVGDTGRAPIDPGVIPLPPGGIDPNGGDVVADTTGTVGDAIGQLSPEIGQTVRGSGGVVDATIDGLTG